MKEIYRRKLNEKYLKDPRWKLAERLAKNCKFEKANQVVNMIRKNHNLKVDGGGRIYDGSI